MPEATSWEERPGPLFRVDRFDILGSSPVKRLHLRDGRFKRLRCHRVPRLKQKTVKRRLKMHFHILLNVADGVRVAGAGEHLLDGNVDAFLCH